MRFNTWPTLKNALFMSAFALLALIPAANAVVDITFTNPTHGDIFYAGDTIYVRWILNSNGDDVSGATASLILVNEVLGVHDTLATGLALQGNGGVINISSSTSPSDQYIVRANTQINDFLSNTFTIRSE